MYKGSQEEHSHNFVAIFLGPMLAILISGGAFSVYESMGLKLGMLAWALVVILGVVMAIYGIRGQTHAERVTYEGGPEIATYKGYNRVMRRAGWGRILAFAGLLVVAFNGYMLYTGFANPTSLSESGRSHNQTVKHAHKNPH